MDNSNAFVHVDGITVSYGSFAGIVRYLRPCDEAATDYITIEGMAVRTAEAYRVARELELV